MMKSTKKLVAFCGLALMVAGAASASPTYLVTEGSTLFRASSGGGVQSFALSDDIVSMFTMPGGEIWAISSTASVNGTFELYRLDGAFSAAPSLTLLYDGFDRTYPGMVFANGSIYGYRDGSQNLDRINPVTFAVSPVGPTGTFSNGGAAYDAATDTFWGASSNSDSIYTVDYSLSNGPTPASTLVGSMGFDFQNHDLDFFNGTLYAAVQRNDLGTLEVGWIDQMTGAFMTDMVLENVYTPGVVGMVVVPAPSAAGLLMIGSALAFGRRRR
ncbi:MAG: PEP-CTERM sorting domain-containing protein [Phycisphaeraceae bacterium]|nr:PEP-CTERM sorting domain-containing protein [Phycisphaeraceae bacterium]MBX3367779.1 PEP-CTERM sorting domain-containing protein [Phycisphaeraceae bacterium]